MMHAAMGKDLILSEIRRIAQERGGRPPGMRLFESETGIKKHQMVGVFWREWSDAVREAGLAPNQLQSAYKKEQLLNDYAKLALELQRLPTKDDLRLKRRDNPNFPSVNAYQRHFAGKSRLVESLTAYCKDQPEYKDVACLCETYVAGKQAKRAEATLEKETRGFVYLVKSGRFYKVGKTNSTGRREYELALQLPEKPRTVHVIRTDDPTGIESYWHRRFEAKRKNGEWFDLTSEDVAAFKSRKVM